jgi:hypothetical protein
MTRIGSGLLPAAGLLCLCPQALAQQTYFTRMLGPEGLGPAQPLVEVSDLAVDSRDHLFVAGKGSDNVLRLSPTGEAVVLIDGAHDPAGDGFAGPIALSVDSLGRLFVACETSATVHRVDPDGTITQLAGAAVGVQLERPAGIAVAPDGRVFVSDGATDSIHELVPGGPALRHVYTGGADGLDHMAAPGRLAVNAAGHVAILCEGTRSVFYLGDAGKLERRFVGEWPWTGFHELEDVAFLPGGDIAATSLGHCLRIPDGGAPAAALFDPLAAGCAGPWKRLAAAPDGSLRVSVQNRLLRVGADGSVRDLLDDPANPFHVWVPGPVAVDSRGNTFVASGFGDEVFQVGLPWPVSFEATCFGDGSQGVCSCGNQGGAGEGCANSTGSGATLTAWGSDHAAADDLMLRVEGLPAGAEALLFAGSAWATAPLVHSDGLRCATGALRRLEARRADPGGGAWFGPGLGAAGGWSPGDTRWFQVLYRDSAAGPCSTGKNLSSAVAVTFTP